MTDSTVTTTGEAESMATVTDYWSARANGAAVLTAAASAVQSLSPVYSRVAGCTIGQTHVEDSGSRSTAIHDLTSRSTAKNSFSRIRQLFQKENPRMEEQESLVGGNLYGSGNSLGDTENSREVNPQHPMLCRSGVGDHPTAWLTGKAYKSLGSLPLIATQDGSLWAPTEVRGEKCNVLRAKRCRDGRWRKRPLDKETVGEEVPNPLLELRDNDHVIFSRRHNVGVVFRVPLAEVPSSIRAEMESFFKKQVCPKLKAVKVNAHPRKLKLPSDLCGVFPVIECYGQDAVRNDEEPGEEDLLDMKAALQEGRCAAVYAFTPEGERFLLPYLPKLEGDAKWTSREVYVEQGPLLDYAVDKRGGYRVAIWVIGNFPETPNYAAVENFAASLRKDTNQAIRAAEDIVLVMGTMYGDKRLSAARLKWLDKEESLLHRTLATTGFDASTRPD